MQKELLAAVVTILIVAGGVVGYLYGLNFATERTTTEVRTSTLTTPSTSVITSTSTLVVPSTIITTSTKVVNFTQTVFTVPYASNETQVCITNIKNPPQKQYLSLLLLIITNPIFLQYSNGRCWTWNSTFELTSGGVLFDELRFRPLLRPDILLLWILSRSQGRHRNLRSTHHS